MSLEKDILNLLSNKDIPHYEILEKLKDRYEEHVIGRCITKLADENKISFSNPDKFIYKITDLGKLELRNIIIKFYLIHWKLLLPIIVGSIVAIIVAVLNYIK